MRLLAMRRAGFFRCMKHMSVFCVRLPGCMCLREDGPDVQLYTYIMFVLRYTNDGFVSALE